MLPDGRRLGAHLALGGGLVKAADRAAEIGATAIQIFGDNPTAWRRRAEPSPERDAFRARLAEHDIRPLAIHASYLINPAGPDADFHERSVALLTAELIDAAASGAALVNVHIGSHRGAGVAAGIERLVATVTRSLAAETLEEELAGATAGDRAGGDRGGGNPSGAEARPRITLENSSGGGWGLGVDLDELAAIADALDAAEVPRDRVAFCLDTAHAWGAGIAIDDPVAVDAFLAEFDARIGLDRLPLVHLNDSKAERGSRMDRHEHVAAGRIGATGIGHLLRHPALAGVTYIVETPGMDEGYDAVNVGRAFALARGEPVEPLPPEAFALRGSRARAATPADVAAPVQAASGPARLDPDDPTDVGDPARGSGAA